MEPCLYLNFCVAVRRVPSSGGGVRCCTRRHGRSATSEATSSDCWPTCSRRTPPPTALALPRHRSGSILRCSSMTAPTRPGAGAPVSSAIQSSRWPTDRTGVSSNTTRGVCHCRRVPRRLACEGLGCHAFGGSFDLLQRLPHPGPHDSGELCLPAEVLLGEIERVGRNTVGSQSLVHDAGDSPLDRP